MEEIKHSELRNEDLYDSILRQCEQINKKTRDINQKISDLQDIQFTIKNTCNHIKFGCLFITIATIINMLIFMNVWR